MMDCVSVAHSVLNLRPRRVKGLRRPTREIVGLGPVELVREERCQSWQLQKEIVPSRLTLVDEAIVERETETEALRFWNRLWSNEHEVRKQIAQAISDESDPSSPGITIETVLRTLDQVIVPYRIQRSGDGYLIFYDCTDGYEGSLWGIAIVLAFVEPDWTIPRIDKYPLVNARADLLKDAYRQRIIPNDCGFVQDSIADRLICAYYLEPTSELFDLLSISLEQATALWEAATENNRTFLAAVVRMLEFVRSYSEKLK